MGRKITIHRKPEKAYKRVTFAVISVAMVFFIAVWALQFKVSLSSGVFDDISEEFAQTTAQIEAGLELADQTAQEIGGPFDVYDALDIEGLGSGKILDEQAQDVLSAITEEMQTEMEKQKQATLPISETIYAEEEIQ